MDSVQAPINHIRLDQKGEAWIAGTSFRVIDVVIDHLIHGFSPTEIQYQHYGELSLGQIHSALSYYFDHRAKFDEAIRGEEVRSRELRMAEGESPIVKRLKAEGKLP
jgi:uncharacterized protein (DUF433 family)